MKNAESGKIIAANIDRYCSETGLTRRTFEMKCGLFNAAVRSWAAGKSPNISTMEKIVSATGIPVDAWIKENGIEAWTKSLEILKRG